MIYIHDTRITDVYIIESGKVKVFSNDLSGNEQMIRVIRCGNLFPHVVFFRNENYPAHSQAIKDTVLYSVSIKQFEDVLLTNPKVSIKLLRLLGSLIVDSQQRLEEMALRNTNERILLLLLRLSKTHGSGSRMHHSN